MIYDIQFSALVVFVNIQDLFLGNCETYKQYAKARPKIQSIDTITATYSCSYSGDSIGSSTTKGSRDIPSNLLNMWRRGSFSFASASLNYHFGKRTENTLIFVEVKTPAKLLAMADNEKETNVIST